MDFRLVVFYCVVLSCYWWCVMAEPVKLTVRSTTSIAGTDDNFICTTLDWWPENKCDYGQCPWGKAGIVDLHLTGFGSELEVLSKTRWCTILVDTKKCPHFKKHTHGLFGFSTGCLRMERWDELNNFFNITRAQITFGLNALKGRLKQNPQDSLWIGDWDAKNAKELMKYTISKGYQIDSYELGNELCAGGVAARIDAEQYAKDMIKLKNLVTKLHPDSSSQPKVLGPGGFYDKEWFNRFLQASGPGTIDGVTHHIYNLGPGVDKTLINKVQDPFFLSEIAETFQDASRTVDLFAPWSGAWIGEAGGAYNSGGKDVSHTFVNGFWYLDELGMTSTFNHKVFCRQALIGGNYALLNTTTFVPNPDYYGALLWHHLMGNKVLSTNHNGTPYLRAYTHCSKKKPGIAVLLINMSNSTTFEVSVVNDLNLYPSGQVELNLNPEGIELNALQREEYHLTPEGGNIQSDVLLLNGTPLKVTKSLDIPAINPNIVDPSRPISVAPDSIVFATLKGFKAPACA